MNSNNVVNIKMCMNVILVHTLLLSLGVDTSSPHIPLYCIGGTECLSYAPGSHSVCAIGTLLGLTGKFSPSGEKLSKC